MNALWAALAGLPVGLTIDELVGRLHGPRFRLLTPAPAAAHAAIVSFDLTDEPAERTVARLAEAGIDVASRDGHVRVSPHLHNTSADIERLLESIGQVRL